MKIASAKDKSDPKNWIDLLLPMEGNLFMIMGNQERVLHHEATVEEVTIKTDRRTRKFGVYDLQKFLEGVEPIEEQLVKVDVEIEQIATQTTSEMSGLNKILLDTIAKVDADAGYVSQAQAINNLAKTSVNLANAHINFMKSKGK